jgi:hypothetical protein
LTIFARRNSRTFNEQAAKRPSIVISDPAGNAINIYAGTFQQTLRALYPGILQKRD